MAALKVILEALVAKQKPSNTFFFLISLVLTSGMGVGGEKKAFRILISVSDIGQWTQDFFTGVNPVFLFIFRFPLCRAAVEKSEFLIEMFETDLFIL